MTYTRSYRRFFRTHCEYIVADHIKKNRHRLPRSRTELIKSIATPMHISYKPEQPEEDTRSAPAIITNAVGESGGQLGTSPTTIATPPLITTTSATPGATLISDDLGLTLSTANFSKHGHEGDSNAVDNTGDALFSGDGAPFTSSPTQSGRMTLSPVDSRNPHVEFARSSAVSPRSESHYQRFGMSGGERMRIFNIFLPHSLVHQKTDCHIQGAATRSSAKGTSGIQRFPAHLFLPLPQAQIAASTNIVLASSLVRSSSWIDSSNVPLREPING